MSDAQTDYRLRDLYARTRGGRSEKAKFRRSGKKVMSGFNQPAATLFGEILARLSMSSFAALDFHKDRRIMAAGSKMDWARWAKLSLRQVERALDNLAYDRGLIEYASMVWYGKKVTIIYLTPYALSTVYKHHPVGDLVNILYAPSDGFIGAYSETCKFREEFANRQYRRSDESDGAILGGLLGVLPGSNEAGLTSEYFKKEGSEGSEDLEGSEGTPAGGSLPKSNQLSEGNQQKPNKSEGGDMGIIGAQTSKEVAEHFKKQDVIKDYCDGRPLTQIRQIQILWISLLNRYYKESPNPKGLSKQERTQVKHLINKVGPTKIGPFLRRIVRNWDKYVSLVRLKSNKASKPSYPSIGYILQHLPVSDMVVKSLKGNSGSVGYGDLAGFLKQQENKKQK